MLYVSFLTPIILMEVLKIKLQRNNALEETTWLRRVV